MNQRRAERTLRRGGHHATNAEEGCRQHQGRGGLRGTAEALTKTTPRRGVVTRVMPARLSHPRRRSRSRLCGRGEILQAAVAVERDELLVAADGLAVDYDLGERHHSR